MTPEKYRAIKSMIKKLEKIAAKADELGLTLDNGAEVGSLIGTVAAELSIKCESVESSRKAA
jgi:hypothetical protein